MNDSDRMFLVGTLAVALFFASFFPALLLGVGCAESGSPEETGLCKTMPAYGMAWWAAVLGPSALLVASQLIPLFRRHFLVPVFCFVVAGGAFWTYVLADATGNLG